MRAPNSIKRAFDILFIPGEGVSLDRPMVHNLIENYRPDSHIRAIKFDGSLQYGAWVNALIYDENEQDEVYRWLYIAAGDRANRQMIVTGLSDG